MKKKIICDYKIVVCTITENDLTNLISEHRIVTAELGDAVSSASIDILLKEVLIGKAMKELGIQKVISYHSLVKSARTFVQGNHEILPVGHIIDDIFADTCNVSTYTGHINGAMPAAERKSILNDFANSKRGLISNAKCLTEGVDVPAIDAVYFVDPKNSMTDIIQATGRALRKSSSKPKNCAYIIIPVVIPDNASLFSHIAPSSFDTLHNVIQAMRSQDSSLADLIDEINFSVATGASGRKNTLFSSKILHMPYSKINIQDFENSLTLRIAEINKNPSGSNTGSLWEEISSQPRKSSVKRVFVSIGDYSLDAYLNSLILPTLKKFTVINAEMKGVAIKYNNNNVSHSVRMGVLSKKGRNYRITPLGKELLADITLYPSIAREQLLKYHCINKESGAVLFPYRTLLKILMTYDYISKFEFLYCIYSMQDTSDFSVQQAIERIQYLRDTYPNINILNEVNKEKVLDILNTKYDVHFGFKDIWTSGTTTYNQFNYFKKHLWIFDNIFVTKENKADKERIQIQSGVRPAIQELLNLTASVETTAASGNLDALNELYCNRICSVSL